MNHTSKEEQLIYIENKISIVESQIDQQNLNLEKAKSRVQVWIDANSDLSQLVAEERARTQSMGRGLGGAVLGSKYRASRRRSAATINDQIARETASKRSQIKQGKKYSQEEVRGIKSKIKELKAYLKSLKSQRKKLSSELLSKNKKISQSAQTINLLKKLHEAYELGILTREEYEEKRKNIVDKL